MKKKTWVATMMADISRSNLNYEYDKAFEKVAEQYANNDLKYFKEESE